MNVIIVLAPNDECADPTQDTGLTADAMGELTSALSNLGLVVDVMKDEGWSATASRAHHDD